MENKDRLRIPFSRSLPQNKAKTERNEEVSKSKEKMSTVITQITMRTYSKRRKH